MIENKNKGGLEETVTLRVLPVSGIVNPKKHEITENPECITLQKR